MKMSFEERRRKITHIRENISKDEIFRYFCIWLAEQPNYQVEILYKQLKEEGKDE